MISRIILPLFLLLSLSASSTNYYVNPSLGNDQNNGTSEKTAFASLDKISALQLENGDKVLLAKGELFLGSIKLNNVKGHKKQWIVITSYGNESMPKPIINAQGKLNGILLNNCQYIEVDGIEICANGGGVEAYKTQKKYMRCGVLVTTSEAGMYGNISLKNLTVRDVFFEEKGFQRGAKEVKSANGTQNYGWGIRFINATKDAQLNHLLVANCLVENVAHTGIKFTGRNLNDVKVYDNKIYRTGGPGMQMCVNDAHVKGNDINFSGSNDDSRKWGRGSGMWTWGCKSVLIEYNSFRNAKGPGDSAGCHIDFNCNDVVVQYCVSENNAGGFCEILGNNYNCAYRYNVSINDGYREKKKNGAFQEGKIFWLSGFQGSNKKRFGPFNSYFYNNTIYVKQEVVAKMAIDRAASGMLIANNIFYIEGASKSVLGDQYKPEVAGESNIKNVVFQNNLFLNVDSWPKDAMVQDASPSFGNPQFVNVGGKEIEHYIPQNTELIKDKGIKITAIPEDKVGLKIGLNPKTDILGKPIVGLPDMGAIEIE